MAAAQTYRYQVETDQGKFELETDAPVSSNEEAQAIIEKRLAESRPIDLKGGTESVLKENLGPVAGAVAPLVAPVGGAMYGASVGGRLMAPLGPLASAAGAVVGAGIGGATGQTFNEAAEAGARLATGAPLQSFTESLGNIAGEGLANLGAQGAISAVAPLGRVVLGTGSRGWGAVRGAARSFGINLTAAEQSGSPFLQIAENLAARTPTGAGVFRRFGEKQALQISSVGEDLLTGVTGPRLDVATRGQAFLGELNDAIAGLKSQEVDLFGRYLRLANPDSSVNVEPFIAKAREIKAQLPRLSSLQSGKLNDLLDDIQKLDPLHSARQALGLPPGASLPAGVSISGPGPKPVTLGELRTIRTELGKIAYPSRFEGAVQSDIPTAQARELYTTLTGVLEADAANKGPQVLAALQEANQFHRTVLVNNLNSNVFYAALLSNKKGLADFNARMFNPRNPTLLLDARSVVSPQGWKMIQQQYLDDVFSSAVVHAEGGALGFDGGKFAARIQKDQDVLRNLFAPETADDLLRLADVAKTAAKTAAVKSSDVLGTMVLAGQAASTGLAVANVAFRDVGAGQAALIPATIFGPWAFARLATSRAGSSLLASLFSGGSTTRSIVNESAKLLTRGVATGAALPGESEAVEYLSSTPGVGKVADPLDTSGKRLVNVTDAYERLKSLPPGDDLKAADRISRQLHDQNPDAGVLFDAAWGRYRQPRPYATGMTLRVDTTPSRTPPRSLAPLASGLPPIP